MGHSAGPEQRRQKRGAEHPLLSIELTDCELLQRNTARMTRRKQPMPLGCRRASLGPLEVDAD